MSVDDYIRSAPAGARPKLEEVRAAIRSSAPEAKEGFSYQMPYYNYRGSLAWFALHKNHIGLYIRPPVIAEHGSELKGYQTTKSAVHLPLDRPIPTSLVKRLVIARVKKNKEEE